MVGRAVAAAKRYFEGKETGFRQLELNLAGQDQFLKRVCAAARRIKWGQTTTYGTLAKELGRGPGTARDVGGFTLQAGRRLCRAMTSRGTACLRWRR